MPTSPRFREELNAFTLIRSAQMEHMQINCFMKTVILNEVYLATGFASRQTHLLPFEHEEDESHFITSVHSRTLGKWVLMGPDMGTYLTDEKGNLLGVAEIRRRMIRREPLRTVSVDTGRSILTRTWEDLQSIAWGVNYLWFLSEFIFKVDCPQDSMFNQRSRHNRVYFELIPDGYRPELLLNPEITKKGNKIIFINDESLFWQKPAGQ